MRASSLKVLARQMAYFFRCYGIGTHDHFMQVRDL